jgi:GT2 family glycosyltransferase/glycosyltransferase involved in cell wall biosynthesis
VLEDSLAATPSVNEASVRRIAESELFDLGHYAAEAGVRFGSVEEGVRHYGERGWRVGLNPSRRFDTKYYLRVYEDVRSAGLNPLEHYLTLGRAENRTPKLGRGLLSPPPLAPEDSIWRTLAAAGRPARPAATPVDVVVPVYRGYDDTLACLHAVLTAASRTPFELTVINDCSPEPALAEHLRMIAGLGLIRLIENTENKGFVGSANVGLFLHADRDVVLLNADTVVYDGWLDRLARHGRLPGVGTATPMSNNATIMSYPYTLENNNIELEVPHAQIDRLFAEANPGGAVDVPTGVGFCFYVRRELLQAIGGFDQQTFGRGYGEENDFCMRAASAGWRNVAALDVYVRHTGEVSFSSSASEQKDVGMRRLLELHPEYLDQVHAFIARDPLRPARQAVDLLRLRRLNAGRGALFIDHGWTGGIVRHLRELTAALAAEDVVVSRLTPGKDSETLELTSLSPLDLPNLPRLPASDSEAIADALRGLDLGFVHLHSLVAHKLENFRPLLDAIDAAGLRYHLTIHDYAPVCPRITMVDWGGSYCASPSRTHCRICIETVGTEFGKVDIDDWRAAYGEVVARADRLITPDQDVETRLRRYLDIPKPMKIRPHEVWARREAQPADKPRTVTRKRTVGIIGAIGPHKGSGVLLGLAGEITMRDLPLTLKLYGYSDRIELERFDCVEQTGPYQEADIERMIEEDPCDLAFLPAVWPETYSYTLDIALRLGLHPVCFDIGVGAARLKRLGIGTLLPLSLVYDVKTLSEALIAITPQAYALDALGPDAWWGSKARYYDGPDVIEGQDGASRLRAAQ